MPRPRKSASVGSLDDISRRRVRLTKLTIQVPEDLHNDLARMVELAKQVDREVVIDELVTDFLTGLRDRYLPAFEDETRGLEPSEDLATDDEVEPSSPPPRGGHRARSSKQVETPLAQQETGAD